MTFRKVSAGRGAGWIVDGLAVSKGNPGGFLSACLLVGLLSSLPLIGALAGLVGVFFYGGLVHALHTQAQGGTAQAGQAFDGFRRPGAVGRLLPIALLNIAMVIIAAVVFIAAISPMIYDIVQQGGTKPTPEQIVALLPRMTSVLLVMLPIFLLINWLTVLSVPRAMLDEVPGGLALREAASALFANLGALLVNFLCLIAIGIVMVLVLMIPVMLIEVVAGKPSGLATLLQIPVFTLFTGLVYALYSSVMYQAWRELFAPDPSEPPPFSQIEL